MKNRLNKEKLKEYWIKRNEQMFLQGEKDILEFAKDLEKQYNLAIRSIEDEIYKFYGKYATENKMSMTELRKLLDREELKSFKESINDIADYVKHHKLDKNYGKQLKLLRLKSKVSRLEELKTKIQFEIEKLNNNVENALESELSKVYEDSYYKTIFNQQQLLGFSDSFAMLGINAIKKAVQTTYMADNYSKVLWRNKEQLLNILNQQIPQGIILGYNPKKVASIASKQLGAKYKSAVRLIRTEYNLILNDAAAKGYKESNIERYEILATLDSRTSDICREMDGEIMELSKKEVGVNYPPFHPNCRTTTIPYFEPDEFDVEIDRYIKDENGIKYKINSELQYKEWKNALKIDKNGKNIYENDVF